MRVTVDRKEGAFLVVELSDGKTVNMPMVLAPDAHEGDIIEIKVDREKSDKRRTEIAELAESLFED